MSFKTTRKATETMMLFEKAATYGVNSLLEPEIIAILTGLDLDQSAELLNTAGGLEGLGKKDMWDMLDIPQIDKSRALRLTAAIEFGTRLATAKMVDRPVINTPDDVAKLLMQKMRYLDREHFMVLLLNTRHAVLAIETVSIGSLSSTIIHPRELFKQAIKRSAAAIILVHNHPSGDPEPSNEDRAITRRMVEIGKLLGIEVLDHIIIGNNTYRSLKTMGVI